MKLIPYTCLITLCVLLTGSCKDFLTITPQDELSRTEVFSTIRGADAAVVGLYNLLGGESYYQLRAPIYADLLTNLEPRDDENSVSIEDISGLRTEYIKLYALDMGQDYAFTQIDNLYRAAYTLIYQANDIIRGLNELAGGTEAQRNSLRGEALAMRAIAHFDLLRIFAQAPGFSPDGSHPGIALVTATPEAFDRPARATVAEGYARVRADLATAAELITPSLSRRSFGNIWLTPTVVYGLAARVASYQEDWDAVISWSDRYLAATQLELTPTERYVEEWREGTVREIEWGLDFRRKISEGDGSFITSPALICGSNNGEPYLQVSRDLINRFPTDDLRADLVSIGPEGDRLTDKWTLLRNQVRDVPMLRVSEIYLLRAEAYAALGREDAANADYHTIHLRANPNDNPTNLTGTALRDAIRTERRLELAFEGHHFFDLGRWGTNLDRDDCAALVVICSLSYPADRYAAPIPLEAILRNPNLSQNPGY
ncbi:MAG: RagB/SusD family nutrient uptake outer membrane protein [Bacteroidota bacterium]